MHVALATALQAVQNFAGDFGASVLPERLALSDLYFIADLPLTVSLSRVDEDQLTGAQRARLMSLVGLRITTATDAMSAGLKAVRRRPGAPVPTSRHTGDHVSTRRNCQYGA